jgi:uncharacterized protein
VTVAVEVDVRDLVGHPGAARTARFHEPVAGMVTSLARVPDDRPVDAELLLESVIEGIYVTGSVSGEMDLSCGSCLKPIDHPFVVEVHELFAPPATADPDEDYGLSPEGVIDIEPMLRDAVVLTMPFSPRCSPDCKGLCSRCGGDLNLDECTCGPQTDPRWDALASIDFPDETT